MSDSDLQVVFGADVSALTQGANQANAAIASLAPALSAAQASLSGFGAAASKAFAPPNVAGFKGAVTQLAGTTAQISNAVMGAARALQSFGGGAAAAAQQSAPLAQSAAASGAAINAAGAAFGQFGTRAQGAATATAGINLAMAASRSSISALSGVVSGAGAALAPLAAAATRLAAPMGQLAQLTTPVAGALNGVRAAAQSASGAFSGVASALSSIGGTLSSISSAAQSVAGAFNTVSGVVASVGNTFASVASTAQSISAAFSGIGSAVGAVNDVIGSFNGVLQSFKGLIDTVSGALGGAKVAMYGFDAAADANPVGLVVTVIQTLVGWISQLIDWLGKINALGDAWNAVKAGASEFWDQLKIVWDVLVNIKTALVDVLTGHWSFDNLQGGFRQLGNDINQATKDAIKLGTSLNSIVQKGLAGGGSGDGAPGGGGGGQGPTTSLPRTKSPHTGNSGQSSNASSSPNPGGAGACECDPAAAASCEAKSQAVRTAELAKGGEQCVAATTFANGAIAASGQTVTNTLAQQQGQQVDTVAHAEKLKVQANQTANQQIRNENNKVLGEFKSSMDGLVSSFSKGLLAMAEGTKSFGQVMRSLGQQVLNDAIKWIDQAVEKWLWGETMKVLASTQGQALLDALGLRELAVEIANEQRKTLAVVQSVATQTKAKQLGASQGLAIDGMTSLKTIVNDAKTAAAGAYNAAVQSVPPPLGAILGAGAAAAAFAAVMAFGSGVSSAAGGYDIPAGVNPLTQLHAQEMVLPARLANPMRDMLAGYGSAGAPAAGGHSFSFGDTHIHGAPNMSPSDFRQALADHRSNVAEAVAGALRGGWRPSYKQPFGAL